MESHWLKLIKTAIIGIFSLRRYWKVLCGFISRVSLLNESRESKQLDNMAKYLDAVAKNLAVMKKNGCPEEEIRILARELNVPLIQANLEAMIIAREYGVSPKPTQTPPNQDQPTKPVTEPDD